MVTVLAVSRPTRCAYCHTNMAGTFAGCAQCGTACHTDCMVLARGCPTLGCSGRRRRRPQAPSAWERVGNVVDSFFAVMGFLFKAAFVLGVVAVVAAIAIPSDFGCRKNGNETAAIGALKTLGCAQSLFREADKEKDGKLDYAESLKELGDAGTTGLIDSVLASGFKNGYHFELRRSSTHPKFCWIAYAWPKDATKNGRVFITNHEGVTHYRPVQEGGIVVIDDTTCAIPTGWKPVGR